MTADEARYLALREAAAGIVSSVHGVIDHGMADEMERLEAVIGLGRCDELTDMVFNVRAGGQLVSRGF